MYIFYLILLLIIGFNLGFLAHAWWVNRRHTHGTMYIHKDKVREKTVYSLVLDDYPEELLFKKEVIFRVIGAEESSDDRE